MYAIMGATGNVGGCITANLLTAGKKVRVIGRKHERLVSLADKGAEICVGNASDVDFLTSVFTGCDSVFTLIPPNFKAENFFDYQNTIGEAICEAIEESGIENVVALSSFGADKDRENGPIRGLHHQEQRLNNLPGVNVLHLRAGYFMENLFAGISVIKEMGFNGSALSPNVKLPMIATKDIGVEASKNMLAKDFSGKKVKDLNGERDLCMQEATRVIGAKIKKPDLSYVQFPYEDVKEGMIDSGIKDNLADLYIEMFHSLNEGKIGAVQRTPGNTTPTSIESFADTFAAIYNKN